MANLGAITMLFLHYDKAELDRQYDQRFSFYPRPMNERMWLGRIVAS
jgi:hypothetical protein